MTTSEANAAALVTSSLLLFGSVWLAATAVGVTAISVARIATAPNLITALENSPKFLEALKNAPKGLRIKF